jgi:3-dehydroquinate dehydratase-2
MKIQIINGPNLNLLGTREPGVYGSITFTEFLENIRISFPDIEIDYFQSNVEGEIINKIQETGCPGLFTGDRIKYRSQDCIYSGNTC